MAPTLYIIILVLYAIVALDHLLPNLTGDRIHAVIRWLIGAGVLLHFGVLVYEALLGDRTPGFPEALSAASLGMMVAYFIVGTQKTRVLGMMLTPLSLVLLGTALVVPAHSVVALEMQDGGTSPWLPIHLALIFAGLGGFSLSFVVGITYLVVRDRLKRKKKISAGKMPSLEVLDRIQFRSMLFGFVFLTLGIAAGGAWAAASLPEARSWEPKVLLTLIIWLWYGVALQLRLAGGWRGRWSALFSIVGFLGLVFSLVGLNFITSGWHGYGP